MQWLNVIIPICPFILDISSHTPCQPAHAHRDLGGKPSGMRVYCLSLRFSQSTPDDLGCNQGGLRPRFGLCVVSRCPPRDAFAHGSGCVLSVGAHPGMPRIVTHRMRNMHGDSHAVHFNVASTTMLMGTNQKAWQSCGSGTVRE